MPNSSDRSRSNKADEILDVAEMLIQTRGYSAISYQDIATRLDIRKASIHYHFPSKEDLGAAVVDRYISRFDVMLAEVASDATLTSMQMFDHYTGPYLEFADTPDRICLCGALAGEILALPARVRAEVERNFAVHQKWLSRLVRRGLASGEFTFQGPPARMATTILGTLQGALLIKRATGNSGQLRGAIVMLKSQLKSA